MNNLSDKSQIGLSEQAGEHLQIVKDQGGFNKDNDVYRLAVAVAIAEELEPTSEEASRTTKYSIGGLDPDNSLVSSVKYLRNELDRPVAYVERLAEAGLAHLFDHIESGKPLYELLGKYRVPPEAEEPTKET